MDWSIDFFLFVYSSLHDDSVHRCRSNLKTKTYWFAVARKIIKKNKLLLTTSQLLILGRHWKFCPGYCLYGNDIWSVLWRHWGSYIISAPTSRWNRQTDDYFSHSCWGMNTLHTRLNRVHSLVFLLKRFWIQGRLQNSGTKAMKRRQRPWDRRQSMFTASFIQPSLAPALAQSRLTSGAMTVTFQNTL